MAALARAGRPGVLRSPGPETGDAADPTIGTPSDTDVTCFMYRPRLQARNDSLIDEYHRRVLVRPESGLVIQQEDKFAIGLTAAEVVTGTQFFEILDVQEFNPGGTILFWELELKS